MKTKDMIYKEARELLGSYPVTNSNNVTLLS